jgi:hypothetical protein
MEGNASCFEAANHGCLLFGGMKRQSMEMYTRVSEKAKGPDAFEAPVQWLRTSSTLVPSIETTLIMNLLLCSQSRFHRCFESRDQKHPPSSLSDFVPSVVSCKRQIMTSPSFQVLGYII